MPNRSPAANRIVPAGKLFGQMGYEPQFHRNSFDKSIQNVCMMNVNDDGGGGHIKITDALAYARAQGIKLILNLCNFAHGGTGRGTYSVSGTGTLFSLSKYQSQMDWYGPNSSNGPSLYNAILPYIADGTFYAIVGPDEQLDPSNWSSGPVIQDAVASWSDMAACADYSKSIFPTLPFFFSSVINLMWGGHPWPASVDGTVVAWTHVNMMGDVNVDTALNVALAKQCGLKIIINNNIPDAYGSGQAITPADLLADGTVLLNEPYNLGHLMYRWGNWMNDASYRQVWKSLLALSNTLNTPFVPVAPMVTNDWLLDQYTTNVAAPFPVITGSQNMQLAEPGPGLMFSVDTTVGGVLSKSGGHMVASGTPTSLIKHYTSCLCNRVPGMAFGIKFPVISVAPAGKLSCGWAHDVSTPNNLDYGFDFSSTTALRVKQGTLAVGTWTTAQGVEIVMVQLGTGALIYKREGSSGAYTLLYVYSHLSYKMWPAVFIANGSAVNFEWDDFHVVPLGAGSINPSDYQLAATASASAGASYAAPQAAADMVLEATWTPVSAQVWNLIFRQQDATNYLTVQIDQTAQTVGLLKVINSASSNVSGAPVSRAITLPITSSGITFTSTMPGTILDSNNLLATVKTGDLITLTGTTSNLGPFHVSTGNVVGTIRTVEPTVAETPAGNVTITPLYRVVVTMQGNIINVAVNDGNAFSNVSSSQFNTQVGAKTDRAVANFNTWQATKTIVGM